MENSVLHDFSRKDDIHSCFRQARLFTCTFSWKKICKLLLQRWEILSFKKLTFFILWCNSTPLFHILWSTFKGQSIWKVSCSSSFNQLQIKSLFQKAQKENFNNETVAHLQFCSNVEHRASRTSSIVSVAVPRLTFSEPELCQIIQIKFLP